MPGRGSLCFGNGPQIIGKRDHSTVIHGIEKIEKDLDKDPELSKVIDVITKKMD